MKNNPTDRRVKGINTIADIETLLKQAEDSLKGVNSPQPSRIVSTAYSLQSIAASLLVIARQSGNPDLTKLLQQCNDQLDKIHALAKTIDEKSDRVTYGLSGATSNEAMQQALKNPMIMEEKK